MPLLHHVHIKIIIVIILNITVDDGDKEAGEADKAHIKVCDS